MAITKERKDELVALYGEILQHTAGFVVTEFRYLSMKEVTELRGKLRASGAQFMVTKNTLLKIALEQHGWPVPDELLVGPVAVAFADGNFPDMAKAVLEYAKEREGKLTVKGGVMTGHIMNAKQIQMISELPSLDELRAQLAGLLVQPATGLVSILNSATGQLVNVLHAYVQEKGGEAA